MGRAMQRRGKSREGVWSPQRCAVSPPGPQLERESMGPAGYSSEASLEHTSVGEHFFPDPVNADDNPSYPCIASWLLACVCTIQMFGLRFLLPPRYEN
jgi:hypothetical protein